MGPLDRHQREALARQGMRQRHGQPELVPFGGEPADGRHDPRGRDGDGPRVDGAAARVAQDTRRGDRLVVVQERLTHPHEHHAADGAIGLGPDGEDLADDLVREEVARKAEPSGGAEGAGQRAARLARDADDVLLLFAFERAQVGAGRFARHGDPHCLDPGAAGKLEEVLDESVGGKHPAPIG